MVGPTNFQALCHDQSCSMASEMWIQPMPSSVRALASGPKRSEPDRLDELQYRLFRFGIVAATYPSAWSPPTSGFACRAAKTVLIAYPTPTVCRRYPFAAGRSGLDSSGDTAQRQCRRQHQEG